MRRRAGHLGADGDRSAAGRKKLQYALLPCKPQGGRLIFMGEISRRYLATAVQTGVPFMLLDFYDDAIAADCVLSDNTSGSYMMTEHLISTGRRNIGFVGSVLSTSSIMDRYLGYVKALLRAGLPIRDDWRLEDRDDRGLFIPFTLPHEMPEALSALRRGGLQSGGDPQAQRLPCAAGCGSDRLRRLPLFHHLQPPADQLRVDLDGMAKTVVAQLRRKMAHKLPLPPPSSCPAAL